MKKRRVLRAWDDYLQVNSPGSNDSDADTGSLQKYGVHMQQDGIMVEASSDKSSQV